METADEQTRTIRFALYQGEIERLEQFPPGPLEATILEAVQGFVVRRDPPISTTSNQFQHGNLENVYVSLPRPLADRLNSEWKPEEPVHWFLNSYRPS